jgi:hypothetical protein
MASTNLAKTQISYINPEFRLKFVDEENYIDDCRAAEYQELVQPTSIDVKREGQGGNLIGGGIGREQGSFIRKVETDERSEVLKLQDNKSSLRLRDAAHHGAARTVNLEAMKAASTAVQQRRKAARAEQKSTTKLRLMRKPIDWSQLDQVGRPVVSFDPFSESRPKLLKILRRDARDRTRQEIVRKLGVEFSRIYERYRRDAERRRNGVSSMLYTVQDDRETKQCEDAAIQCVLRAVTPRQVLEYWDANIKNYTNGNLTLPPLAFLKSPSVIDRVATSALGTVGKMERLKKPRPSDGAVLKPATRNTFSGTDGLDLRLRPTLEKAGYPTQAYNDRYMLSIQHNALAIANGKNIFLAEGRMRNMVKYAAKNLYNEASPNADN